MLTYLQLEVNLCQELVKLFQETILQRQKTSIYTGKYLLRILSANIKERESNFQLLLVTQLCSRVFDCVVHPSVVYDCLFFYLHHFCWLSDCQFYSAITTQQ